MYLCHIGSFLPCSYAKIGMVDAIYTIINHKNNLLIEL